MAAPQKKRKKKNWKRKICGAIIVIMMICFIFIGFLLVFQVKDMEVEGNTYLTKQEVADYVTSGELGSNSLYVLARFNLTDYKRLPAIESVKVGLKNPWTLKVKVNEKQVVGYIVSDDEFAYFDEDGIVLDKTNEWWENIPEIEGIDVGTIKLYEELPVSKGNKKVFSELLEMSESLSRCELAPTRVVCHDACLHLYFDNKCVVLGSDNYSDKIQQIPPIFEKLESQGGTLHLEHYTRQNTTISFEKDVYPEEDAEFISSESGEEEVTDDTSSEE